MYNKILNSLIKFFSVEKNRIRYGITTMAIYFMTILLFLVHKTTFTIIFAVLVSVLQFLFCMLLMRIDTMNIDNKSLQKMYKDQKEKDLKNEI